MTKILFQWPALLVLAAIAAVLYLTLGADATAVLIGSAPGLMLANVPLAVPELKGLVESIGEGFKSFKQSTDAKLAGLQTEIERVESKGNLSGLFGTKADTEPRAPTATPAERKAFDKFLRTGDRSAAAEAKALSVGSGPDGGYAVPTWFDAMVHSVERKSTVMLDLVQYNKVSNFPARHIVSLGQGSAGWVSETGARPETWSPKIASVEVPGCDVYCFPMATRWALDDIRFDAAAWLASEIGLELSQNIQAAIITGNGTNKPLGFLASPNALTTDTAGRPFGTVQFLKTGVAANLPATTSAIIDLLLNCVHSLNQRYRQDAVWLMSTEVLGLLRTAKDTTGRPVLLDSLLLGQPATLLGYPVYETDHMPVLAANAYPIAFGNFKRGYVLDEHEAGLRVVIDEVTNKPFVGFYSVRRIDGKVLDSNAIKIIKCAV